MMIFASWLCFIMVISQALLRSTSKQSLIRMTRVTRMDKIKS